MHFLSPLRTVLAAAVLIGAFSLEAALSEPPLFSEVPTDAELFAAHFLEEPLVPMSTTKSEAEDKALLDALHLFRTRSEPDDFSALEAFLSSYPQSRWKVSLLSNLGSLYRQSGYFSRALKAFEEAWQIGKGETESRRAATVNRTLGEWMDLQARIGRYEWLDPMSKTITNRRIIGSASEKITGAKDGLWTMVNTPDRAFLCGPFALTRIAKHRALPGSVELELRKETSSLKGTSLQQLQRLADRTGMELQMARRIPGSKVLLPAVVHWKVGHFAAIIREVDGRYEIQDPTFAKDIWISQGALDEEASGYFLVPTGELPAGWNQMTSEEGAEVWGRGSTSGPDPNQISEHDHKTCTGDSTGMARHAFHLLTANLNIVDTPLGYEPPRGPSVQFRVTYNYRESAQPGNFNYSNLGPKWTFDWMSYVSDNPTTAVDPAYCYLRGGGGEVYERAALCTPAPETSCDNITPPYDYHPQVKSRAFLRRTAQDSFERTLPNGAKDIFGWRTDTAGPRKVFLFELYDQLGNKLTFNYDAYFRLTHVVDAIGQTNILAYGSTNLADAAFYQITKVTDPFGRYATLQYNTNGLLWKITDVIGITSEFQYATNSDFLERLITPYGTNTFAKTDGSLDRSIEATDPLGQKERVEYKNLTSSVQGEQFWPDGWDANQVGFLGYRNSFYWDKKAMAEMGGTLDYNKAHIYHWLHDSASAYTTGILESEKKPLESRIWYRYPGQTHVAYSGSSSSPSVIARVLDDLSTQKHEFKYNDLDQVLHYRDPIGRETTNIYLGIRLAEVRQKVNGDWQTIARFSHNLQHLPTNIVGAAGQTNFLGYDSYGQLTAVTNALGQAVKFFYDTNGYLTNITGIATNDITTFAYDAYGRVQSVADPEGYTLSFEYDALNRPTKTIYMDQTYEQAIYDKLDPVLLRDRRGRWSKIAYNPLRQVLTTEDPNGTTTKFDWCSCGSLSSITDGMNRTTAWIRDLQGRVTDKIFPDNSVVHYEYEGNTSRLKWVRDAMEQVTHYRYNIDDTLANVTYSNAVHETPPVAYTYDTNFTRMATMQDWQGITTFEFYPITNHPGAGMLKSINGPWANDTIEFTYDELGRTKTRSLGSAVTAVNYDNLGRVLTFTNVLGAFTNTYVSQISGRLDSISYPNGQTVTFGYENVTNGFRLASLWNRNGGAGTISKFEYGYDVPGRIESIAHRVDGGSADVWRYGYDFVDQLRSAVLTNSIGSLLKNFAFGYDPAGNILSQQKDGGLSQGVHNRLNQLKTVLDGGSVDFKGSLNEAGTVTVAGHTAVMDAISIGFSASTEAALGTNVISVISQDYNNNGRTNRYELVLTNSLPASALEYDANGNLVSEVRSGLTNTYEWDAANRLITINSGTNRTEFEYDGFGRRIFIAELQNGALASVNAYFWCQLELCEERDAAGATVSKRYFPQGMQKGTNVFFYAGDHLGSIREMTDTSGTIRARYDYDAFGTRTSNLIETDAVESDFAYTGHYYHKVSGLHIAPYRSYDSRSGRWLSMDPLGEAGGLNLYGYVANNPINDWDALGLFSSLNGLAGASAADLAFLFGGGAAVTAALNITVQSFECPDNGIDWGRVGRDVAIDAALTAATFGGNKLFSAYKAGRLGLKTRKVTSWADKGITPDLKPGRWVMLGGPTKWNFWKSGLAGPKVFFQKKFPFFNIRKSNADFSNFITDNVPVERLQLPPGPEIIKAPLGQRVLQ